MCALSVLKHLVRLPVVQIHEWVYNFNVLCAAFYPIHHNSDNTSGDSLFYFSAVSASMVLKSGSPSMFDTSCSSHFLANRVSRLCPMRTWPMYATQSLKSACLRQCNADIFDKLEHIGDSGPYGFYSLLEVRSM